MDLLLGAMFGSPKLGCHWVCHIGCWYIFSSLLSWTTDLCLRVMREEHASKVCASVDYDLDNQGHFFYHVTRTYSI